MNFDVYNHASPALADLLKPARTMPLDAGEPDRSAAQRLQALDQAALFAPATVRDDAMARACLAGLWLWFDDLDASHRISQELQTPEGSYWHAIMHRREGDFGNSKYWFRRVGHHPAFASLGEEAKLLGVFPTGVWDPFAFVDRVECCVTGHCGDLDALVTLQRHEWEILFEHCYQAAVVC